MSINEKYRGRGLGVELMIHARESSGKKHDLSCLCGPVNDAVAGFYEKIGGKPTKGQLFAYMYPEKIKPKKKKPKPKLM